jgi:hypothetical protein
MSSDKTELASWIPEALQHALDTAPQEGGMIEARRVFLFDHRPTADPARVATEAEAAGRELIRFKTLAVFTNQGGTRIIMLRVPKTGEVTYGILDFALGYCAKTSIEQLTEMWGNDLADVAMEAQFAFA